MTLEKLEQMIDKAIADGAEKTSARDKTNALNAEYALGKVMALLEIIDDMYGIDEMYRIYDRTSDEREQLFIRAQAIY